MLRTPAGSTGKSCKCPACGTANKIPDPNTQNESDQDFPLDIPDPLGNPYSAPVNPYQQGPSYGSNPYQAPGPKGPTVIIQQSTSPAAGVSLGLGIGSLVIVMTCCLCYGLLSPIGLTLGIIGLVLARGEAKRMRERKLAPNAIVQTGQVLSIVGIVLNALVLISAIVLLLLGTIGAMNDQPNFRNRRF
ncbi:MAG TPA: hypothetical protein PKD64_16300 [Pirellulaceae bacterium]|nr:hypothetical protein [Pirellulaceae bacterium]HMO93751.1 hypothetical protein [Pirellulaceae bacterium]HMP69912.1 hypothetical protein [Pirellulaceae bacterium]